MFRAQHCTSIHAIDLRGCELLSKQYQKKFDAEFSDTGAGDEGGGSPAAAKQTQTRDVGSGEEAGAAGAGAASTATESSVNMKRAV